MTGGTAAAAPPVRVVVFFGPYLRSAREFLLRLEEHPEIELAAAFCEGEPESVRARVRDLFRRRGLLAPGYLAAVAGAGALRWLTRPGAEAAFRRELGRLAGRVHYVPDLHAREVLAAVRALEPDVGAIYGGPILRPELFGIPRHGSLGVHHGRLPEYRGKKTTFWEMYCGEPEAGVTIQLVNAGIDTGRVVARGAVPACGRAYRSVWRDVQREGIRLFVEAILAVGRGRAIPAAAEGERGPLRRDPGPADILALWWRQLRGRRP